MCGHVGVAGDLWQREEVLMKRLLVFDWIRGPDSTGLAVVRNDGEIVIAKVADNPFILLESIRFRSALSANNSKVFMGHNRAATSGKIEYKNTHPFEVDNIVGCHNGTLSWESFEALKKEVGDQYTVDSHALIAAIAKLGIKKAIGMVRGSWSLVWYDKSDGTLNFLRNGERPMTYGYSKDFKRLYWASESVMLDAATKLTGSSELFADKDGNSFWQTAENMHYRFVVDDLKKGSDKPWKPKTREIKGKEVVATSTGSSNFPRDRAVLHGTTTQNGGTGTKSKTTGKSSRSTARYNGGRDGAHQTVGHPLSPFGRFLDRAEFEMLTYGGCSWCDEPLKYGECGIAIFERGGHALCPTCSGEGRRNRLVFEDRASVPTVDELDETLVR